MTPHFKISRTRHLVVSSCEACGETSGLTRSDTAAAMWQRRHRAECDTEKEENSMNATCACCGQTITTTLCCPVPPGEPWGTKCDEHKEASDE